ncbi:20126_t:CDS:2, partial [Racocetra persica]
MFSESCHTKINKYRTNLNLKIAIERLNNNKTFHAFEIHNKSSIAMYKSNHGIISRAIKSIKKT